jgi:hypothetical protein
MVTSIMNAGYAYRADDGSVYFSMDQVKDYGKLSGMKIDEMLAGTRVDTDENKRNPADFALWKSAKPGRYPGPRPGVMVGQAGISSARRCAASCSVIHWTSMEAGTI